MATRAEHRRNTLLALDAAAVAAFEEMGPSATVDLIAERAGVSRRTVFRYVDGKEELAFIHPILWFDVFERGLAEAPDGPLGERLRVASLAIAEHIDDDPDPPRRAFLVVAAHPELARGYTNVFQRWIDRVAAEVLASEASAVTNPFRARIVGAAIMGMVDATTRAWLLADGASTFAELYEEAFSVVEPLFS